MSHPLAGSGVAVPDWGAVGAPEGLLDSLRRTVALTAFIVAGATAMLFVAERLAGVVELQLPVDARCDAARGGCATALPGGGEIRLAVTRPPGATAGPLRLQVSVAGAAADHVEVDLSGVNMRMAADRQNLSAEAPGRFAATVVLPACSSAAMIWEATVRVRSGVQRYVAPYRFSTAPH